MIQSVLMAATAILSATHFCAAETQSEFVEHQTNASLNAFYGVCLNEAFVAVEMDGLAKRLGWQFISKNELEIFIPKIEAPFEFYRGYLFLSPDNPPVPIAVFAGLSDMETNPVEHCSMFMRNVLVAEFVAAFVDDTEATVVSKETKIGAVNTFYEIDDFPGSLVLLESEVRNDRGLRITFLKLGGES